VAGSAEGHGVMIAHDALAVFAGSIVSFVLGLIGGGGSILAVPLLVYVVGVPSPHVAIGTSAVAVALSAIASLIGHAREHHVKWSCAIVFSAAGLVGAMVGSSLGKAFDGQKLLSLFGVLMIIIAGLMLWKKTSAGDAGIKLNTATAPKLLPVLLLYGLGVGALSGFFGIGGGFLIVPGLMAATGMPMIFAIGSSLVSVATFGLATAGNYALSGLVDWYLVALFICGGVAGSVAGRIAGKSLSGGKQRLSQVFAGIVGVVGMYVVAQALS
jgi:uncharacterized membrane protein YfcA